MVGFLSQNYITHHNNLVNMIVLLESFPSSKSLCIWNKLYASLYLKMLWTCHFSKFWMKCSLSNFGLGRNCSPIEEYVLLWFYNIFLWFYNIFLSKQILQVLWMEMVEFLSQNYITLHNNLVNMIVLLKYFSTSISVCIWNKLYASFCLKHVIFQNFKCGE